MPARPDSESLDVRWTMVDVASHDEVASEDDEGAVSSTSTVAALIGPALPTASIAW